MKRHLLSNLGVLLALAAIKRIADVGDNVEVLTKDNSSTQKRVLLISANEPAVFINSAANAVRKDLKAAIDFEETHFGVSGHCKSYPGSMADVHVIERHEFPQIEYRRPQPQRGVIPTSYKPKHQHTMRHNRGRRR